MKKTKPATVAIGSVLGQLCKLIPGHLVAKLARKHGIDKQARTFIHPLESRRQPALRATHPRHRTQRRLRRPAASCSVNSKNAIRWQLWSALLLYVLLRFQAHLGKWSHLLHPTLHDDAWVALGAHEPLRADGFLWDSSAAIENASKSRRPCIYRDWLLRPMGQQVGEMTRYREGRIRNIKTPDGDVLSWKYVRGRVVEIASKKEGVLLEANYRGEDGLIESLSYNEGKERLIFGYENIPLMTQVLGQNLVGGLVPSLASMERSDGEVHRYEIKPTEDQSTYQMHLVEKKGEEIITDRVFKWDPATHWVVSDGKHGYAIEVPEEGNPKGYPRLARTDAEGKTESYFFDSKKMVATSVGKDGVIRRRSYIGTPGLSFLKVPQGGKNHVGR